MGIAAPITAVLAAAAPVLFGVFAEGLPSAIQLFGFALALVGVWFVSRLDGPVKSKQGLGLALVAGLAFGGLYVLIGQVSPNAVFWPLRVGRRAWRPDTRLPPLVVLAGLLDVGGNAFFLLAA